MNPDELKRVLLIMGVKAPSLKLAIRQILDHMVEEDGDDIVKSAKVAKDLPKTVERYVKEHKEQGMDEDKAWAIAWSRYCKYKNPGSPRCKQDDYFKGRDSSIAGHVASEFIRLAYLPNIPNRFRQEVESKLMNFIRAGLSPFPTEDPQRVESKLAGDIFKFLQKELPPHVSVSTPDVHQFIGHMARKVNVSLRSSVIEDAMSDVLGESFAVDNRTVGMLEAQIETMIEGLAQDASRGAMKAQRKAVSLLARGLGIGDYEAQQILDYVVSEAKMVLPLTSDQINSLLGSYLDEAARAASSEVF